MAEKLSIIIALSGAEEIKRQLADVGQAGKDCFKVINDAAAEVGGFNKLDTSRLSEGLVNVGVAGKDVAKVLNAVKQAGRMETLVNGIAAVENEFANLGVSVGELGKALKLVLPSARTVSRLLVVAFGAAVVGAIVSTTKALLDLDASAIQAGKSIEDMAKAQEVFKQIGLSGAEAAKGAADFIEKMDLKRVTELWEKGGAKETFDALAEVAKGTGKAAEFAREKLKQVGLVDVSPAAKAIDQIQKSAQTTPDKLVAIVGVLETMGDTAERNRIIFDTFSKDVATKFIQALNAGIAPAAALKQAIGEIPAPTGAAAQAATRLSTEWEKLKAVMGAPFSVSPEAMSSIANLLQGIRSLAAAFSESGFRANAQAEFQAVIQFASQMVSTIIGLLASLGQAGFQAMKYIELGAVAAWQTIIGWINKAIDAVRRFFGAGGGKAMAGGDAGGFARGGIMGGRGSGTSDSNLAWLSRGEHIMPAYAVRQPGVLQLLEALRRSGGNLRGVLDRMGHFALGGMVGAPAFAGGGVGGMSNVTIQFPGVQPITGLRASSAVVDELRRSAALAQVRSGGRKPSRYT
jgi:hypothetical protein